MIFERRYTERREQSELHEVARHSAPTYRKEQHMKELAKTYNPKEIEDRLYQMWQDKKYFHAEVRPEKKQYTIEICRWNGRNRNHQEH